jgi:uncharacterized protein YndB with AHSA1/START domain
MLKRNTSIRVSRRFRAPAEDVFDAWLDPGVAGKWLFATASRPMAKVAIDARVAGSFRLVERGSGKPVAYTGEYVEILPPRRLAFTLSADHHPRAVTRVRVDIVPLKSGCDLTVTNENVPPDYASRTEARWTGILYGLGVTLDTKVEPAAPATGLSRRKR